jgi:ribonuclease BN (tRNA processing enzyme)
MDTILLPTIRQLEPDEKLSLTTKKGTTKIFLRNFQTNLIIVSGDTHLVVDFGQYAPLALAILARLQVSDLHNFMPTHSHADHVGSFENVALTGRYITKRKPKVIVTKDYQEILWSKSLAGGLEWNEEVPETRRKMTFEDYYEPTRPVWKPGMSRETMEVTVGEIQLELFRTKHVPSDVPGWAESFFSIGFYLPKEQVFVSMDTRFDPDLVMHYADRGAKTFFHDVQFFPEGVHAELKNLRTLPPEVKERMYLMHYSDTWESQNIDGFAGWTKQGVEYIFDKPEL